MVNIDCMVPSGLRLFEDSTCSHRLGGLPSPSDSPSLLHLRTLLPQRHVASFWQGTVEPQPPPHAHSVLAWPIARQGFYGSQPTIHPSSGLSRGRSPSPHTIGTGSYDDHVMITRHFSGISVRDDRSYRPNNNQEVDSVVGSENSIR